MDDGVLADYAAAAHKLGLTNARMTQVMNLLQLAPQVQERLLLGTLFTHERHLRTDVSLTDRTAQIATLEMPTTVG